MWKCDRLTTTLNELNDVKSVGEIILIDNTNNPYEVNIEKVRHIKEGKNTYVNPAWNKGVSLAKWDKIIILNDDIWFDWNILDIMYEFITEEVGVVGMDEQNYNIKESSGLGMISTQNREGGFGCCMFMHKSNYNPIAEQMLIWGGDDWLFVDNRNKGKQNYKLIGLKIEGYLSLTADTKNADLYRIMEEDLNLKHSLNLF